MAVDVPVINAVKKGILHVNVHQVEVAAEVEDVLS